MVGAGFGSHRTPMGDGFDGTRFGGLPRLRSLPLYSLVGASCAADAWNRSLSRGHLVADLDRLLPCAIFQSKSRNTPTHEPGTVPLRASSTVCGRDCGKGSNGADLCKRCRMVAGCRLGFASAE